MCSFPRIYSNKRKEGQRTGREFRKQELTREKEVTSREMNRLRIGMKPRRITLVSGIADKQDHVSRVGRTGSLCH